MSEQKQSLAQHAKFVPAYHFVLFPLGMLLLGLAVWELIRQPSIHSAAMVVLAFVLLGTLLYARVFALQVQDRLIRLEMRLRLQDLVSDDLRPRIAELTPGQMVALRFASDEELPELVRQVLDEGIRDRGEIKKRIRTWTPDHHRC